MSQAMFSQKKLCPEVENAAVTDGSNLFVFAWARLILFPAHFGDVDWYIIIKLLYPHIPDH